MDDALDAALTREAIRDLVARYTIAGDRLDEEAFVAVFTQDAVLETDGVAAEDAFRHEGRDAIRRWIARWREQAADGPRPNRASFVRHHLSTIQIDLTGADSARARIYWVAHTDIGPDHAGLYLDSYRRVHGDWRIAHRRIREDWRSPESLFGGTVTRVG